LHRFTIHVITALELRDKGWQNFGVDIATGSDSSLTLLDSSTALLH
jgi:hypothetical protein